MIGLVPVFLFSQMLVNSYDFHNEELARGWGGIKGWPWIVWGLGRVGEALRAGKPTGQEPGLGQHSVGASSS